MMKLENEGRNGRDMEIPLSCLQARKEGVAEKIRRRTTESEMLKVDII